MEPELLFFNNPPREEYRLPNAADPETGELVVIVRHNDNGAAVTTSSGYKAYYINGLRHRVGGPAIEFEDFKVYYENGKRHRLDGPAIIYSNGNEEYWENGVRIK